MSKKRARALFYLLLIMLIGWPVVQMYQVYVDVPERENALVMLHQVSVFQLQILNSSTAEAGRVDSTGALDSLQQAVYTAQFAHQRLMMAVGRGEVTEWGALNDFLQYVLSLQITGNRTLMPEEIQVLERMHAYVVAVQPVYKQLITDQGKLHTSVSEELAKLDEEMRLFLQAAMLE